MCNVYGKIDERDIESETEIIHTTWVKREKQKVEAKKHQMWVRGSIHTNMSICILHTYTCSVDINVTCNVYDMWYACLEKQMVSLRFDLISWISSSKFDLRSVPLFKGICLNHRNPNISGTQKKVSLGYFPLYTSRQSRDVRTSRRCELCKGLGPTESEATRPPVGASTELGVPWTYHDTSMFRWLLKRRYTILLYHTSMGDITLSRTLWFHVFPLKQSLVSADFLWIPTD